MPKKYNTLKVRLAALKEEGKTVLTAKAARGVRMPGKPSKDKDKRPTTRGRRIDPVQAYQEGLMVEVERDVAGTTGLETVPAELGPDGLARLDKARTYAKTLIQSGIEPRQAIMRASLTYKVEPRDVAVSLAEEATVVTNRAYGPRP